MKCLPQANHGGVKGKLPSSVVNQVPTMSSQNKTKSHGSDDESQAESDDEEDRPSTPYQEELNKSDDEDDTVMAYFHQRRRRRIPKRILVLCRFFHWYGDRFQSPDSNVWNRDGDPSLKWVQ